MVNPKPKDPDFIDINEIQKNKNEYSTPQNNPPQIPNRADIARANRNAYLPTEGYDQATVPEYEQIPRNDNPHPYLGMRGNALVIKTKDIK